MKLNKLSKILLAAMLLGVMQAAPAALTIQITQGVDGALPIAVVPFDTSKLSTKLPIDFAQIVSSDLNRSGVLKAMDKAELPANPHYSNQVKYSRWKTAGQDYLVVGRVEEKSPGVYNIEFQLLDVLKRKQLLGRRMSTKKTQSAFNGASDQRLYLPTDHRHPRCIQYPNRLCAGAKNRVSQVQVRVAGFRYRWF